MRKILFVASEAVPFIKSGGLADVAGSLPKILAKSGDDVRVVMPEYRSIKTEYAGKLTHLYHGEIMLAWRRKYIGIDSLKLDGVTYYFIDNDDYFGRSGLYGYDDDAERFAFFCRAVCELPELVDFFPDVMHTNDWHTALVNVYLRILKGNDERYAKIRTMFTIHNLKYQGVFDRRILGDVLGLDEHYFNNGDLEFNGAVNLMKGAIIYADFITTVSATYAREIRYPYFGEGLDGLLRKREDCLFGIVNGIDYELYNPETDKALPFNYSAKTIEVKRDCREAMQKRLNLPVNRARPVISLVTRLVEQKGIDLVMRIIDEVLIHEDVQFVLLGTGDAQYEDWFRGLAWRFPTKVSVNTLFSDELAKLIYAGTSMFLMPSRFEPCGLSQLIAMRYGAVPIVRETGGLADTVQSFDKYTESGTGFSFVDYNAHELLYAIKRSLACFRMDDGFMWRNLVRNAMTADFGWQKSAAEYQKLYDKLIGG